MKLQNLPVYQFLPSTKGLVLGQFLFIRLESAFCLNFRKFTGGLKIFKWKTHYDVAQPPHDALVTIERSYDPRVGRRTAETLVYLNFSGRYQTTLRGRRKGRAEEKAPGVTADVPLDVNDDESIL